MCLWFTSDEASNLATVISSFTTVAAVLIAWCQFSSWKKQQTSLKKSEVAGRLYIAVKNLMEAIKTLVSPFSHESFSDMSELTRDEAYLRHVVRKQDIIKDDVRSFNDHRSEAEVYLHDDLIKANEDLWKLYSEVNRRLSVDLPKAMKYGRTDEEKKHMKFLYQDIEKKLSEFEKCLSEPLKIIARMEQKNE